MNLTYQEAYEKYISYKQERVKPQTLERIKNRFELHILPYFGKMKIKKIDSFKYFKWQKEIEKKNFSHQYKKTLHYENVSLYNFLYTFYNFNVNVPKKVGNFKNFYELKKKRKIWNYENYYNFSNSIQDIEYKTLFDFLFMTGARLGETLALKFSDLEDNKININKTITKNLYNGKKLISSPKTQNANREILIDEKLKNRINKLKQYYKLKYDNFNNDFFIFGGIKNLTPSTIERRKNYYCKIAGVEQIRIHDFRHSHASILMSNNVPISVISERLGHSSINITLETYIHIYDSDKKRVLNTLSELRLNK